MKLLSKKGELRRIGMILIVGLLLFGVFVAVLGLALTSEEEKQQLEAELAEIEGRLAVISAGLGQELEVTI